MEADGKEDIESNRPFDISDLYVPGQTFGPNTSPSSKRYDGTASFVEVNDISMTGTQITLRIAFNAHIEVVSYQAGWRHDTHHGIIVLRFQDGTSKQLEPLDYGTYMSMLDSLRCEKPLWYDPNQNLLATYHEPVGEQDFAG